MNGVTDGLFEFRSIWTKTRAAPSVLRPAGLSEVATGSYNDSMRAIGIKAFKDKVSEYVRLASGGEIVLVTDRDRIVAELGPPLPGRAKSVDDARLADLVRRGVLTPPLMKAAAPPRSIPMLPIRKILRGLDEDRSER